MFVWGGAVTVLHAKKITILITMKLVREISEQCRIFVQGTRGSWEYVACFKERQTSDWHPVSFTWCIKLETRMTEIPRFWNPRAKRAGIRVFTTSFSGLFPSRKNNNAGFFLCDTIAWFVQKLSSFPFQQHKNSEKMFFLTWVKHKCNTFTFNRSTALLKSLLLRSYWQNSLQWEKHGML